MVLNAEIGKVVELRCELSHMDDFKTWFNSNFSLSLNGKWSGLDRVKNLPLFLHKLNKVMMSSSRYGSQRRKADIITMRVSGQICKLYYR